MALPITILVAHANRVRTVNIHDAMKIPDDESIFRSFYTQKNVFDYIIKFILHIRFRRQKR